MRFADAGAAITAYRTQGTVRPWRDDGCPNRPLTSYTVEFVKVAR